jgi:protocatechuate 3,4-dioxygenase beta subunit
MRISLWRLYFGVVTFALFTATAIVQAANAGTTGSLGGTVVDSKTGAPIASAAVSVTSPSQSTTAATDKAGHFEFLSLIPDTYTVAPSPDPAPIVHF